MISIRSEPTHTPLPPRGARDYISYSALSLYQSCPLRFYFRYIAGLPERTISASLVFGSAIHRAIEHHFNEVMAGCEPPTIEALMGEYDRHWQDNDVSTIRFGKGDDLDSLGKLASRMLAAFQMSKLAQPVGHIIGVEEELRGQVVAGCPDILGRIDLLEETTDELIVTDFKTARSRWSQTQIIDSTPQLLLYSELVRPLAPHKRHRLQFAVLSKAKATSADLHTVVAEPREVTRTKRIVERVCQAIDHGMFYPAPSPMSCPSCTFRAQCRAWSG